MIILRITSLDKFGQKNWQRFRKIRPEMRKKINYEKVTFLGGFGGIPPKKKEIRSLRLLCSNVVLYLLLEIHKKFCKLFDAKRLCR